MYGASIGKLGITGMTSATNQAIAFCVPDPEMTSTAFLFQLLLFLRPTLTGLGKGGAQPNISQTVLKSLEVSLPPLDQQAQIVRVLESIAISRKSAVKHLAAARKRVHFIRQGLLLAACSGRLTSDWRVKNDEEIPALDATSKKRPKQFRHLTQYELGEIPDTWRWVQVDDVLPSGGIFDGPFGSNLKSSDYAEAGARVIRLENIGHLRFIGSKKTFVPIEKYEKLLKHSVHSGDVVFSSFVDEQIRVCILPDDLEAMALAKADCFTLRPSEAVYRPYLALQLASPAAYRCLMADVHGATRPRVNTAQVRSLPIPICSIAEQHEIVHRFMALSELADGLLMRVDAASRRLDRSSHAVLTKAFRGDLVPAESGSA
jgi:type I restriction enzyme S subunit